MATLKVETGIFGKKIDVPASKSHANRLLILAALFDGEVTINNLPLSSDVDLLLDCFKTVGLNLDFKIEDRSVVIKNSFPQCERDNEEAIEVYTGDGGTTTRFLISLLARGKNRYLIKTAHRMSERPMEELYTILTGFGAQITPSDNPEYLVSVTGPIKKEKVGDKVKVDCKRSTQFITALALSFSDLPVTFTPSNLESSQSYFKMTLNIIKNFYVSSTKDFVVPVDFSSLSYPIALGLYAGGVVVENYTKIDRDQADSCFLDLINKMGGGWKLSKSGLEIMENKKLKGVEVDCSGFPDLVPTLAFTCSYATTQSKLKNLGVLRHKESDRVSEILKLLDQFKVEYSYDTAAEDLTILGNAPLVNSQICHPSHDHRMVMVSYLFLRKNSGGELANPEDVKKSFANFFEIM